MTCKEKLKLEHQISVDPVCIGGCEGCPSDYGYLEAPEWCKCSEEVCRRCWGREIPGSEHVEWKNTEKEIEQN